MTKDPSKIYGKLSGILKELTPPLKVGKEDEQSLEIKGTKEAMQGKQKVDGYFFAGLNQKPKDVRLYYFPIYTHADAFGEISEPLRKALKGKSCFHIKKLDEALEKEIREMADKGLRIYQKEGLV